MATGHQQGNVGNHQSYNNNNQLGGSRQNDKRVAHISWQKARHSLPYGKLKHPETLRLAADATQPKKQK